MRRFLQAMRPSALRGHRGEMLLLLALSIGLNSWGVMWSLPSEERNAYYPGRQAMQEVVTMTDGTQPVYEFEPIDSRNPDEKAFLGAISKMNPRTLDFVPHGLPYGHLFAYAGAGAMATSAALGLISIRADRMYYVDHPEQMARMILAGRLLSVFLGAGSVLLLYLIAGELSSARGLPFLSAALLAICPIQVFNSHWFVSNSSLLFSMLFTVLASIRAATETGVRWLVLAGIGTGLAISSKQSGIYIFAVPLLVAMFYRPRENRLQVLLIPAAALVAFIVSTPPILLAPRETIGWALEMARRIDHAVLPHLFLSIVSALSVPLALCLSVALVTVLLRALRSPTFPHVLLAVWTLAMVPPFLSAIGPWVRYALPLMAPLCIGAAWLVAHRNASRLLASATGVMYVAGFSVGLLRSGDLDALMGSVPLQDKVSAWVEESIPRGESIALALPITYAEPVVNEAKYALQPIAGLRCEKLPDRILTTERAIRESPILAHMSGDIRKMTNDLNVPMLIPNRWSPNDWMFLLNTFVIISHPQCQLQ